MQIPGYTIIKELGRGGMATVYLAVQDSLDREVALKVMSPALLTDPSFGSRFLREAKIVAKLSHPHIIPIYDVGTNDDFYYIAMEFESGGELKDKILSGIPLREVVKIISEISEALHFAHQKGYIHRDVKPENILFSEFGTSLLSDFGVARANDSATQMTAVGTVIGTPLYMSPEQVQGKPIDNRADLYSLGIVFFELLMGHPPFRGDSAVSVAVKHMTDPVPLLPERFTRFQPFFDKLLSKNPDHRHQSGADIISDLTSLDYSDIADEVCMALQEDATEADREASTVLRVESLQQSKKPKSNNNANQSGSILFKATPKVSKPAPLKNSSPYIVRVVVGLAIVISIAALAYFFLPSINVSISESDNLESIATERSESPADKQIELASQQKRIQRIELLLSQAQEDIAQKRLAEPQGNNAYEKYSEILKIESNNKDAQAGLQEISNLFLLRLKKAIKQHDFEQALHFYDQAQIISPNNSALKQHRDFIAQSQREYEEKQKRIANEKEKARLAAIEKARLDKIQKQQELERQRLELEKKQLEEEQKQLEEKRKAKELAALQAKQEEERRQNEQEAQRLAAQEKKKKQQQIDNLLKQADNILSSNKITKTGLWQAHGYYKKAYNLNPQYPKTSQTLQNIVDAHIKAAESTLQQEKLQESENLIKQGLKIDPANRQLIKLKTSLKDKRTQQFRPIGGF